ncbi:MAG: GNAT family N-acetyltransferase [Crocinitomicaceae bacterium]|nr:GNAT family N-acetyltransferase [Flavobacteriales bacterium]NQZ35106.1 GNAT family N-acetyltransferase [Crocinitomicaceae bacterium]
MKLITDRLSLSDLNVDHSEFMYSLMNSPKWKEFIGDRKIQSVSDAQIYIQKTFDNPDINYWVIQSKKTRELIGVLTFMKRDYFAHFDIGFALLPEFFGNGFAFEASTALLDQIRVDKTHEKILATTMPSNKDSIQLLKKLGLSFLKEIQPNHEVLHVYSISSN